MPKLPNISPKSDPEKNKKPGFNLTWVYFIIIIGLGIMLYQGNQSNPGGVNKEVDYTTFRNYVKQGVAKEVVVNKTEGNVRMVVRPEKIREIYKQGSDQTGSAPTVSTKYPNIDTINGFLDANYQGSVKYEESDKFFMSLLSSLLPIILLVFLWFFLMRRMGGGGGSGGIFNVGKSKARLFDKNGKNATHVTFKDVAGQEGAKQEIREIVDFLKTRRNIRNWVVKFLRVLCSWVLRERVRRCLPRLLPARLTCRSSLWLVPTLSKCLSAWVQAVCATSSNKRRKKLPVLCLSTKLMPSAVLVAKTRQWGVTMNAKIR